MTRVADGSEVHLPKKKSLLEKFDLPLYHLDFEYVKKCKDVKELEKILKVLRSKEEGHYPELESCVESQLSALDSKNRLLRKGTKVMAKADLSKEDWNNITTNLLDWKNDIEKKNSKFIESKSRPTNGELPNIRSSTKGFQNSNKITVNKNETPQRINSLDYKSWEKFDAEEECKKMDLLEETKVEVEKRENSSESKRKKMSIEESAIKSLGDIGNLSQEERETMALTEKDIGNEYYRSNNIEKAIKHYTRSIHLHTSVAGLNNRAAAYLRQCAFNKALEDLHQVVKLDPKNVKAKFRRAQSFQHKNMFREALDDINEVLLREPSHVVARHIADQLRDSISKLPKKHRIKIFDRKTGKTTIKTVTEKEMLNDYKNEKFVEVNDWGFPKIMCNCNDKHRDYPGIRHEDHIRYQNFSKPSKMSVSESSYKKSSETKRVVKKNELAPSSVQGDVKPSSSGVKLEIIEVEKGSEETKSDSVGSKEEAVTSPTDNPNSCVVADMRRSKTSSLPADKNEKVQKTSKNDKIKDTTSNAEDVSPSQLDPPVGNQILPVDQVKEVKTDKNITIQENRWVNGFVDPKQEPLVAENRMKIGMPCGCQGHFPGFQFMKEWNALAGPDALQRKADLLKSICPKHLVQAFGNFWDQSMLVDVVKCLLHHFNHTEQQRVFEYVTALPKLDRFNIVSGFLDKDEKSLIQELMKNCSVHLDSNIISAFPS
ncbi:hypothetical protein GE061_017603 [Apolygus lucorum]|uniref:RNA-polymerase II-associated protein 3-like C-terminal domain-containing protein n=1 Tax=Apolygus lucorum TaxID=248454 RepID=A0A8S9XBA8_APOLU|nr:hypothetical protein GE061_017603 [Apolygus lucorum]